MIPGLHRASGALGSRQDGSESQGRGEPRAILATTKVRGNGDAHADHGVGHGAGGHETEADGGDDPKERAEDSLHPAAEGSIELGLDDCHHGDEQPGPS